MTIIPRAARALFADRRLEVEFDPALGNWIEGWLPGEAAELSTPVRGQAARIEVDVSRGGPLPVPEGRPLLTLGSVALWLPPGGTRAEIRGPDGLAGGVVDLESLTARLSIPADARGEDRELHSILTLSAALLIGRLDRALIHAAGVVAPGDRVLLLAGDTWSGKSTTTVNLITAGWDYLSDDQVLLFRGADGGLQVEGWPRPFHLDAGWEDGAPKGVRHRVGSERFGPGRLRSSGVLGALLFPEVVPEEPTRIERVPASLAFAWLIRQTPWLLVDRPTSNRILSLLTDAAHLPSYRLRLGLDTYRDPGLLAERLSEAVRASSP